MKFFECAEPFIPEAATGILIRDWKRVGNALSSMAAKYHNENGFGIHESVSQLPFKISEKSRMIVSAVMYAAELEGEGIL